MTPTVHALRNEIRVAVDRFEREVSSAFTKEALAAIAEAVGYEVDTDNLPSKAQMRAGILSAIGELDTDDPAQAEGALRKAHLEAIAEALRDEG
jgi:hypothetical protein